MKGKQRLPVDWANGAPEEVPVVSATRLELLAAKRFVRFMRGRGAVQSAEKSVEQHDEALLQIS